MNEAHETTGRTGETGETLETRYERVPQIVMERGPLSWVPMVGWTLLGLVVGFVAGYFIKVMLDIGGTQQEPVDPVWLFAPASSYVPVVTALCAVAGLLWGLTRGAGSEEIKHVELPMTMRERLRRRRRRRALVEIEEVEIRTHRA